jgi:AcrR family transcriptional regulator
MLTYPPENLPSDTGPDSDRWYAKARTFHHGDLRASALARAREIVAAHGPTALTMRGLARDLGVTSGALMYHFGRVADLRAAVAGSVLAKAAVAAKLSNEALERLTSAGDEGLRDAGTAWHSFAAANANLYRLASGEGWRAQPAAPTGIHARGRPVFSPRYLLRVELDRATRNFGAPKAGTPRADYLAFTLHGLALARLDGVPEATVAHAWEVTVAASRSLLPPPCGASPPAPAPTPR